MLASTRENISCSELHVLQHKEDKQDERSFAEAVKIAANESDIADMTLQDAMCLVILVSVTPDSGTTQTILHEKLAVKAGLKIRRTGTDISNANGAWLTVVGEADIRITYDKYIHETAAFFL